MHEQKTAPSNDYPLAKLEQLANQLVESLREMSSIEELKRHAKLLLKSAQFRPAVEVRDAAEEGRLLSLFYSRLLERLKELYPALFRQYDHVADKVQLFEQELDNDRELFNQIRSLQVHHSALRLQLQTLFDRSEYRLPEKSSKGNVARRQIRKAPRLRESPESGPVMQDHVYVRLMAKSQSAMQFMLRNKNFPRLELKVSVSQCLQQLVGYLQNKWVKTVHTHRLLLYPDPQHFLRKLKPQDNLEPLNMYYMMSDLLNAYDFPKSNVIGLYYEFVPVEPTEHRSIPGKSIKPTTKKIFELGASEEDKCNQLLSTKKSTGRFMPEEPEGNNQAKAPLPLPSKPEETFEQNARYESIQLNNDSLDLSSLFRRPANSNSIIFGPSNYSNRSLMGFGFLRREETIANKFPTNDPPNTQLEALREAIRSVEGEEKQDQESFTTVRETQVVATPMIKRKNGNTS